MRKGRLSVVLDGVPSTAHGLRLYPLYFTLYTLYFIPCYLEAGRPLERAALLDALVELGGMLGVETPTLDMLAALLETLEATQLRPARV